MNILIISGSHRPNSESKRIANIIIDKYLSKFDLITNHDLSELDLPYWDEGLWSKEKKWDRILNPLFNDINKSDAFIFIVPEWGGMVPPKFKNYLLLCNQKITGHKPALIISISSGVGGAYPVNELRTSGYKNTKINYIPEHIILRNVKELFINDTALDQSISERINFCCKILFEYAKALIPIRELNLPFEKYPYGM